MKFINGKHEDYQDASDTLTPATYHEAISKVHNFEYRTHLLGQLEQRSQYYEHILHYCI